MNHKALSILTTKRHRYAFQKQHLGPGRTESCSPEHACASDMTFVAMSSRKCSELPGIAVHDGVCYGAANDLANPRKPAGIRATLRFLRATDRTMLCLWRRQRGRRTLKYGVSRRDHFAWSDRVLLLFLFLKKARSPVALAFFFDIFFRPINKTDRRIDRRSCDDRYRHLAEPNVAIRQIGGHSTWAY